MTMLETERLVLMPYKKEMADVVYEVVKQSQVADTMLMVPHPYPRKQLDGWIAYLEKSFELGSAYEYAVFTKQSPARYIGSCGLIHLSQVHQSAEIGFFINPSEWGNGYATEACLRIVESGFCDHRLNRLFGRCLSRNPAAHNVLKKAGMVFEGRFKQEVYMNGVFEDIDYFAMVSSEFHKLEA